MRKMQFFALAGTICGFGASGVERTSMFVFSSAAINEVKATLPSEVPSP
jgi:hypothetical protein